MSTYEQKMSAFTNGNMASSAKLNALFGPADVGSGGSSRQIETDPALKSRPDLA